MLWEEINDKIELCALLRLSLAPRNTTHTQTHFTFYKFSFLKIRFDRVEANTGHGCLSMCYMVYLRCMGVLYPCAFVCVCGKKKVCYTLSSISLLTYYSTRIIYRERNKPKSEELSINTKSLLHRERHRILGINPYLSQFSTFIIIILLSISLYLNICISVHTTEILRSFSFSLDHLIHIELELITIRNIHTHIYIIVAYLHTNGHRINYS